MFHRKLFFSKIILNFFFQNWLYNPGSGSGSKLGQNPGSGSKFNVFGSTTLVIILCGTYVDHREPRWLVLSMCISKWTAGIEPCSELCYSPHCGAISQLPVSCHTCDGRKVMCVCVYRPNMHLTKYSKHLSHNNGIYKRKTVPSNNVKNKIKLTEIRKRTTKRNNVKE